MFDHAICLVIRQIIYPAHIIESKLRGIGWPRDGNTVAKCCRERERERERERARAREKGVREKERKAK
jgi:hypothetical protein